MFIFFKQINGFDKKDFKSYLAFLIVILILSSTYFSVLTTRRTDTLTGTTDSEVNGYKFMLYKSQDSILSPILPPIQRLTDITIIDRITRAWDDEMKDNAINGFNNFSCLIGISQQWIILSNIL